MALLRIRSILSFSLAISTILLCQRANCITRICEEKPGTAVGIESAAIPDASLTASSSFHSLPPRFGRLNGNSGSWNPSGIRAGDWLQVDLGEPTYVIGVGTQGRHGYNQYTKSYKLSCSLNGTGFTTVKNATSPSDDIIFLGNYDRFGTVYNTLPSPMLCRYFRIVVVTWHSYPAIRWEVYREDLGCCTIESTRSNFFETYNVTIPSWASPDTTLDYSPSHAAPGMKLMPGVTTRINVTARNTSNDVIATCQFAVSISIFTLPVECSSALRLSTDPGKPTHALIANPTLMDGYNLKYDNITVTITDPSRPYLIASALPLGTYFNVPITYIAADIGLYSTCTATVAVSDKEKPTVTCPADIMSNTTNVLNYTVSYTDNNPTGLLILITPTIYLPGARFPLGRTTITATAVDYYNNRRNCTFVVTNALTELPITCPATDVQTVATDAGQPHFNYSAQGFFIEYPPESKTYFKYGSYRLTRKYGNEMNNLLPISSSPHQITVTLSDGTLNRTCLEASITVQDRESPVIVCPEDVYQTTRMVNSSTIELKTSSDNSGRPLQVVLSPTLLSGGRRFHRGNTTYTYTVTDESGNMATCSFDVSVNIADRRNLPVIIGCSVAAVIVAIIIWILLMCYCLRKQYSCMCCCGPKKTSKRGGGKSSSAMHINKAYQA